MSTPQLPNEGAWLLSLALRERGLRLADVDRICGFGERSGTTSRYLKPAGQGGRLPRRQEALRLEAEFGIAVSAWDKPIGD